jgi:hypothetical protein
MGSFKIRNNYKSGISVFGYYSDEMYLHFTCINQDASTPDHAYELNFKCRLEFSAKEIIDSLSQSGRIYVPIEKPY